MAQSRRIQKIKTREAKKKFSCDQCNVICSSQFGLTEHLRKHTGIKPFSCKQCNSSFKRMMGLRDHERNIHGASGLKQYKCTDCDMVTSNAGNVLRHYLLVHRSLRRFICSICLSQYSQNQELKNHLKIKHNIAIDSINIQEKKSITEIYVLPAFNENDRTDKIKNKIQEIVKGEKLKLIGIDNFVSSIKNNQCETNEDIDLPESAEMSNSISTMVKPETYVNALVDKIMDKHDEKETEFINKPVEPLCESYPETWISIILENPDKTYDVPCKETETDISTEIPLTNNKTEVEVDSFQKDWECNICKKIFFEKNKLIRHSKIHKDEKRYKCNVCNKQFHEQHNLLVHHRVHTKAKPYFCVVCGKHMRYHKDVIDHINFHLDEKKFSCVHCDKKFLRKRDCDRHMLLHDPSKRLSCEICDQVFTRKYLLTNHRLKHNADNGTNFSTKVLFKCDVCKKIYKTSKKFLEHKSKHSDMNELQCYICRKEFMSKLILDAHLRNHIPKTKNISCTNCSRKFSSQDTLKMHMERFHKPVETQDIPMEFKENQTILITSEVPNNSYEIVFSLNEL